MECDWVSIAMQPHVASSVSQDDVAHSLRSRCWSLSRVGTSRKNHSSLPTGCEKPDAGWQFSHAECIGAHAYLCPETQALTLGEWTL